MNWTSKLEPHTKREREREFTFVWLAKENEYTLRASQQDTIAKATIVYYTREKFKQIN